MGKIYRGLVYKGALSAVHAITYYY